MRNIRTNKLLLKLADLTQSFLREENSEVRTNLLFLVLQLREPQNKSTLADVRKTWQYKDAVKALDLG